MSYPPAPWKAHGDAVYSLRLIDIRDVRSMVPAAFRIVAVLPGKTLCSIAFANYRPGSTLAYHELIVVPALVSYGRHLGAWISHMYVDNPDAMQGGREIWGLPKQMARFDGDLAAGRFEAWAGDQLLCTFESRLPALRLPVPVIVPYLSLRKDEVLSARSILLRGMGVSHANVIIPESSPFGGHHLDGPTTGYHQRDMSFRADGPKVIGALGGRRA